MAATTPPQSELHWPEALTRDMVGQAVEVMERARWRELTTEQVAYIMLGVMIFRLEGSEWEGRRVELVCDCGGRLVVLLGAMLTNRHQLLTYLIDHGHGGLKRGIAILPT